MKNLSTKKVKRAKLLAKKLAAKRHNAVSNIKITVPKRKRQEDYTHIPSGRPEGPTGFSNGESPGRPETGMSLEVENEILRTSLNDRKTNNLITLAESVAKIVDASAHAIDSIVRELGKLK